MNHSTIICTKEQLKPYILEINKSADKLINYSLIGYFLVGLILAVFHTTWYIALGIGGTNLLLYYSIKALFPKATVHHYIAGMVLGVFAVQFIYQMQGLFEMNFFIFVACSLLIMYQNWKVQIPLICVIVFHYASVAYLQRIGGDNAHFTQNIHTNMQNFAIHGSLVALVICICGYWSYDIRKKTILTAINTIFLQQQLKSIQANITFADEISNNNLKAEFQHDSNDELAKSLLNMRNSLLKAAERENQEKFTNVGVAEIGEILRHNHDLATLSFEIISKLVKYLGVNQGGLFIRQDENESDIHLSLTACYAYERRKYLKKRVEIGEGLVGQSMLEKDTIYITDVPAEYISITSGLGYANPKCILVVPLKSNDEVIGVVELASFNEFAPFEIAFLEKVGESIASTILSARITQRTSDLLQHSEMMAEEMRAQEEEMRQNMEELLATQEESERRLYEFQLKIEERDEVISQLKQSAKV